MSQNNTFNMGPGATFNDNGTTKSFTGHGTTSTSTIVNNGIVTTTSFTGHGTTIFNNINGTTTRVTGGGKPSTATGNVMFATTCSGEGVKIFNSGNEEGATTTVNSDGTITSRLVTKGGTTFATTVNKDATIFVNGRKLDIHK